ncbi:MAG: hypothetical protein ABFS14_12865 [Gemmatimonadota bacterium]
MMDASPQRIAAVRATGEDPISGQAALRLTAAMFAGSPRVMQAAPGLCRVDARGWGRRGGETALAGVLLAEARKAGFATVHVGVADVAIAADAAAWLARAEGASGPGCRRVGPDTVLVEPGSARRFLAPLPLSVLPMEDTLRDTLHALGLRTVSDLVGRERAHIEARFGLPGVRVHRLGCGEDDRQFPPLRPESFPQAAWEMEGSVTALEPLLFVLRHLLSRVCADLEIAGKCAERLQLRLTLTGGSRRKEIVIPARPTRREQLLYDLCRAALERIAGAGECLPAPAEVLMLRVLQWCCPGARQGDLFDADWRDPLAAAAAISRIRARLGDESVVWPALRRHHRPEVRNSWVPVDLRAGLDEPSRPAPHEAGTPFSTLRLLPRPAPADIRTDENRPRAIRDTGQWKPLLLAEGPERYSGDWWGGAFYREYYRACTIDGEILWIFREARRGGWWLHGWWD